MSLRFGILGFLQYGKQSGYELNKAFQQSVDFFWHATTSQIYRELTWLEKNEMVVSETVIQTEKPNKKEYEITAKGEEAFLDWLNEPLKEDIFQLRNAFLMKVFFSGERSKKETLQMLQMYQQQCTEMRQFAEHWNDSADQYKDKVDDPDKSLYWLLAADFGRRYLQMSEEWVNEALKLLSEQGE